MEACRHLSCSNGLAGPGGYHHYQVMKTPAQIACFLIFVQTINVNWGEKTVAAMSFTKELGKLAGWHGVQPCMLSSLPSRQPAEVVWLGGKGWGNDHPGKMVEGLTFTIEPILTLGLKEGITWPDNWTTVTSDGRPAAQFEHTILISRTGAEILTKC
ncbi:hypothetical protein Cgig2_025147 [Carnegiea gigantea]|uniref:Methionine aminopeptidase n=1 Tax=Carnegiea gigantea TaxID=171969 RepID=A0A9Q1KRI2_9CARY|nr:hypothetical protein Cgig2_025147 [Carnegiea gigantea]